MAYRKTITVNPLSKKSINNAIRELRDEKKRQEKLIDTFMDKVATRMCAVINSRFMAVTGGGEYTEWGKWNSDVTTAKYTADGHNRIIQAGGSQIAFIEFGAGAEANPGIYPTKGGEKEDFLPGSYSKDNRGTYQAWERAGYPGLYYYEQKPARGFDTAIGEFHTIVKEVADEVFK